jgi:signal transduction protein with GAF and PtsI domain
LLALGIRSLSMNTAALATINELVRSVSIAEIGVLQESLLTAASPMRVYDLLQEYYQHSLKSKS